MWSSCGLGSPGLPDRPADRTGLVTRRASALRHRDPGHVGSREGRRTEREPPEVLDAVAGAVEVGDRVAVRMAAPGDPPPGALEAVLPPGMGGALRADVLEE